MNNMPFYPFMGYNINDKVFELEKRINDLLNRIEALEKKINNSNNDYNNKDTGIYMI